MVSRSIATAAFKRENSRGAHFREDFTGTGDLNSSEFTRIRYRDGQFVLDTEAVCFTRVAPGQSLLEDEQSTGT
jgi:fumarate reductase flavoprotein subunit